ncbi:hypothetical protein TEA_001025 [Camellia sinensis var. sinensis]|uniref:Glucose-6-phosphate isomerase n=1 Tax=Camellia sinensis var. sinensis TaxID=542762 RepID=A0A4S4E8G1_CAMSN|nr:hypothetical protein TEA_001025 [Camellia sinensis var. sinensis]
MASISGLSSSSSTLKPEKFTPKSTPSSLPSRDSIAFPNRSKFFDRASTLSPQSVARDIPASLSSTNDGLSKEKKKGLLKNPRELWQRYVDWLYQHKDLGLYLDVSRIGFTDEFVGEMEPKFQAAFKAMEELEKGSIANPDEGRMVGHYWLRNPKLAPKSILRLQIENTLEAVRKFADDVVSGKIKPPSSPEGRFTHVLSVGIGGSALGPQFVAEALAPDNPPLKVCNCRKFNV